MTYGVKRGYKAPGEFGISDMFGLGLAGSAGIIAALVTDYQQSGETSALFTINQWAVTLGSILGFSDISLGMVVAGLTLVGALSTFYFQPITRQGAFAQGFGLLAVMMTAIPSDVAGGLERAPGDDDLPGLSEVFMREARVDNGVTNAAYQPGEARIVEAQQRRGGAKYDLHLTINFPDGIPENIDSMIRRGSIRGRLHNEGTDETWSLFRSAGGQIHREGDTLHIHAGVPARSDTARLWVRIECRGYAIQVQSATAQLGATVNWVVDMKPSSMPLFIQRFGKSYWF